MSLNFGQNLFPPRGELLANYDYQDVLRGQAYIDYDLSSARDETGTEQNIIFPSPRETVSTQKSDVVTATISTDTKIGDYDFDIDVGVSSMIEGKAISEFNWFASYFARGPTTDTFTSYVIVRLRKWDGTTETEIGYAKSNVVTMAHSDNATHTTKTRVPVVMDCARTTLHKGDILRVTVETWVSAYDNTSDDGSIGFYTDPLLRVSTVVNYGKPGAEGEVYSYQKKTNFKIDIPFKLNI